MGNLLETSRGAPCACFITGALAATRGKLLTRYLQALRTALRDVQRQHRFRLDAFAALSDHLHAICSSRGSEAQSALFCRALAAAFARHAAREAQLRLHWYYGGRHDEDAKRLINHIHLDPVQHGLTTDAALWPLQSAAAVARWGLTGPNRSRCAAMSRTTVPALPLLAANTPICDDALWGSGGSGWASARWGNLFCL